MSRFPMSSIPSAPFRSESWWRRRLSTAVVFVGIRVWSLVHPTQQPAQRAQPTMTYQAQIAPAPPTPQEDATLRTLLRFFHHELQSAVTGLRAYLALTAVDSADELAGALAATVTKMHDLSQRMVVLSRDGQDALCRQAVDLRAVIASEVAQLRTQGAHLQVTASVPDEPVLVWADPTLIGMAVGTALRNAAESYDPLAATAPIAVCLSVTATDAELVIADQGPGFPAALLTTIAAARPVLGWTTKAHGSGTGISLILGVAQLYVGRAAFCNQPGGGASVTVTLPLVRLDAEGALPDAGGAERCP